MKTDRDQRLQLRFPVRQEEGATGLIDLAPAREEVQITDLSLGGAGLIVPEPGFFEGTRQFKLALRWPDWFGETPAHVVHVRPSVNGTPPQVGVRFRNQDEHFLRGLCSYIVRAHSNSVRRPVGTQASPTLRTTRERRRLRRTLLYCCRQRVRLRVYHSSGALLGSFYPTDLASEHIVGNLDLLLGQAIVSGMTYSLVLHSFNSLYRFSVRLIERRGLEALFSYPDEMAWGATRYHARINTGGSTPVWLEFFHPQIPGKAVRKCAREVGFGGLSFALNVEEDVIAPGTLIESALLRLPEGQTVPCRCVVRHSYREASGSYACGIKITEFIGGAREAWFDHILTRLSPEVRPASADDIGDVWQVLEKSGYLDEKPLKGIETVRDDFARVWSALTDTGSTKCWIHEQKGRTLGTISVSPLYSKAYLAHHLAVDRHQGARLKLVVLGSLVYRTVLQWLTSAHPDKNLIAYFSATRPFNRIAWFGFLDAYIDSPQIDKKDVRVFDCPSDCQLPNQTVPAEATQVRPASQADVEWVSADLLQRDTPFVHRAFDYEPSTFGLKQAPMGTETPLQRTRTLLVVGPSGGPLSYAICETSARGTNIFSLYDTCRVVIHQTHESSFVEVRDDLFRAAAAHYRALGTTAFLLLQGAGDAAPPENCAAFEAAGVRAVVGPDLIPKWAEHLNEVFAHG